MQFTRRHSIPTYHSAHVCGFLLCSRRGRGGGDLVTVGAGMPTLPRAEDWPSQTPSFKRKKLGYVCGPADLRPNMAAGDDAAR